MEEQKTKEMRVETVKSGKENGKKQQRLTYEELNDACAQLYQQNQNLYRQLQEANLNNMFKRLDYLFKVIENDAVINDDDFLNSCVNEIKEALTISKEDTKEE